MKVIDAFEKSFWVDDYCLGISRNNLGGYSLVWRYPHNGGEVNVFIPICGNHEESYCEHPAESLKLVKANRFKSSCKYEEDTYTARLICMKCGQSIMKVG